MNKLCRPTIPNATHLVPRQSISGTGEEVFKRIFNRIWCGGHLGHVTSNV